MYELCTTITKQLISTWECRYKHCTHKCWKHIQEDDIKQDEILQTANIISINETHLSITDALGPDMMNLMEEMEIFHNDRNSFGGEVALIVNIKFHPQHIDVDTCYEICAVRILYTSEIVLISVYRPPSTSICEFTNFLQC